MKNSKAIFFVLWTSMLVSTTGTFTLQVMLAGDIFKFFQSGLYSSFAFTAAWIFPVIFAPLVSRLSTDFSVKRVLVVSEFASVGVFLCIYFLGYQSKHAFLYALFLISIRGMLEAISKASRVVLIKTQIEPQLVPRYSSFYNTSLLLGNGLGGAIAASLPLTIQFTTIAAYAAGALLLSSVFCLLLQSTDAKEKPVPCYNVSYYLLDWRFWFKGFAAIKEAGLGSYLIVLSCCVGIFQAYHTVARTAVPMGVFKASIKEVGITQVTSCVGLVIGAALATRLIETESSKRNPNLLYLFLTSVTCLFPLFMPSLLLSNIAYAVFMLFFELCWVIGHSTVIVRSPKEHIGSVTSFIQPTLLLMLIVGSTLLGFLHDQVGIYLTTFLAVFFCWGSIIYLTYRKSI